MTTNSLNAESYLSFVLQLLFPQLLNSTMPSEKDPDCLDESELPFLDMCDEGLLFLVVFHGRQQESDYTQRLKSDDEYTDDWPVF